MEATAAVITTSEQDNNKRFFVTSNFLIALVFPAAAGAKPSTVTKPEKGSIQGERQLQLTALRAAEQWSSRLYPLAGINIACLRQRTRLHSVACKKTADPFPRPRK